MYDCRVNVVGSTKRDARSMLQTSNPWSQASCKRRAGGDLLAQLLVCNHIIHVVDTYRRITDGFYTLLFGNSLPPSALRRDIYHRVAMASTTSKPWATGSCLCGKIRYEVASKPEEVTRFICHCVTCKKASGSCFMSNWWMSEKVGQPGVRVGIKTDGPHSALLDPNGSRTPG